eukprot:1404939-Rhodomonas_salina.1
MSVSSTSARYQGRHMQYPIPYSKCIPGYPYMQCLGTCGYLDNPAEERWLLQQLISLANKVTLFPRQPFCFPIPQT